VLALWLVLYGVVLVLGLDDGNWGIHAAVLSTLYVPPLYRWLTAHVTTSDAGLTIRNTFWTYTLTWQDVARFELPGRRFRPWPWLYAAEAILLDGTRIAMHAVATPNAGSERQREALAAAVAELARERRAYSAETRLPA